MPPQSSSPASTASPERTTVGPYQLLDSIGAGGAAELFRASHTHPAHSARIFAVKLLHRGLDPRGSVAELFRREAFLLSLLRHPNIVRTYEAGIDDGCAFIAMEYIAGRDLDSLLQRCRHEKTSLPLAVILFIFAEVLRGLHAAHELCDTNGHRLNLVHRDIKPDNIFLSFGGAVKLGDFGVAAIVSAAPGPDRMLLGTPGYLAPEQINGDPVDQRADQFALGCILFELICGKRLFSASTLEETVRLNQRARIPRPNQSRPDLPVQIEEILQRALRRNPKERFPDLRAMLAALAPFMPETPAMPLAVAALMRRVFAVELTREMSWRRERGDTPVVGSGEMIGACTPSAPLAEELGGLLVENGFAAEIHAGVGSLLESVGGPLPPRALILDINARELQPKTVTEVMTVAGTVLPVIALADDLEVASVEAAFRLGAADLLVPPITGQRLTSTLLSLLAPGRGGRFARHDADGPSGSEGAGAPARILLVTGDARLGELLASELCQLGFEVETVADIEAAIERTTRVTFRAYLYDVPTGGRSADFTARMRGLPGLGTVPIIHLTATGTSPEGGDRTLCRPRRDSAASMAMGLHQLMADIAEGRSFMRYPTDLAADLTVAGSSFSGRVINISRVGILVACSRLVPVHSSVNVILTVPGRETPVEAHGWVARVELLEREEGPRTRLGIELCRFEEKGEAAHIALVTALDAASRESQPVGE